LLLDDSDPNVNNTTPFIASTNPNEEYTHPIAESDNIQALEHGWNYTLRELIGEYKKNRFQKVIGEGLQSIKLIPFYKCTYCDKEFSSEEEQKIMNMNGMYSKISYCVVLILFLLKYQRNSNCDSY
jgi:hypothetical protein